MSVDLVYILANFIINKALARPRKLAAKKSNANEEFYPFFIKIVCSNNHNAAIDY